MLYRWLDKLNHYIAKPRMIMGYKNNNGLYVANTRISNTVDIISADNLIIADNVYIGPYNYIEASHKITIGTGCQITSFISITSHSSHNSIRLYGAHYIEHNANHFAYVVGEIIIGEYTFIGPHSLIMPKTKIGKGSIVSAYSLVKGEFPDFSILAGNPAMRIGDTRDMDNKQLERYPELRAYYEEWAK